MICTLETLTSMDVFTGQDTTVLQRKLEAVEKLIRAYTNNNFQVRAARFEASSNGTLLAGSSPYLKVGDTVEISKSGVNDGLYVIQGITGEGITVDEELFAVDYNLVTLVKYPDDVVEGVINLLTWEIENRQKVGIKTETLSRHSVTYYDQDANNQVMGYPVSLLGFLQPYIKARF